MMKPTHPPLWLRSSHCSSDACAEVARSGDAVLVRDSKNPHHPPLEFTLTEWAAFLAGARNGEFDFA